MDGDDIYVKDCHEAGKRVQQQTEAVIVGRGQREFYGNIARSISLIALKYETRVRVKTEDISHKNRFGFGSTIFYPNAVREMAPNDHIGMGSLSPTFNGPVNWLFYTPLILAGAKAIYIDESHVFYRQHEQNELGNNQKGYEHSIRVKAELYSEIVRRGNLNKADTEIYSILGDILKLSW